MSAWWNVGAEGVASDLARVVPAAPPVVGPATPLLADTLSGHRGARQPTPVAFSVRNSTPTERSPSETKTWPSWIVHWSLIVRRASSASARLASYGTSRTASDASRASAGPAFSHHSAHVRPPYA